jgi:hypothetical protein
MNLDRAAGLHAFQHSCHPSMTALCHLVEVHYRGVPNEICDAVCNVLDLFCETHYLSCEIDCPRKVQQSTELDRAIGLHELSCYPSMTSLGHLV